MSYAMPQVLPKSLPSYKNYRPVAWPMERYSPVPGWGMRPHLSGPRQIGIGGLGMDVVFPFPIGKVNFPVEAAIQQSVEAAWPSIEAKLKISLDEALDDGKKAMHADVVAAGVAICAVVVGAAWWVKRK